MVPRAVLHTSEAPDDNVKLRLSCYRPSLSLGEEHLHVQVPACDFFRDSGAEVIQTGSHSLGVGFTSVLLGFLDFSLVVDAPHVSE